jgi:hypothetical protein
MPDPTPEELADRARRLGADGGSEQDIQRLIDDAEAGGADHMAAVASQVASWPSSGAMPSVYDMATCQPAYHESNILIECRIRVEGELMTLREAVDPYMFETRFAGEPAEFDLYIDYALERAFGLMARDPKMGPIIRKKLWVIKPGDKHDFKRCAESEQASPAMWHDPGIIEPTFAPRGPGSPVPYCADGVIVRPPGKRDLGNGVHRWSSNYEPLGACPCRCHQRDGSYRRAEHLILMHRHFPMDWTPGAAKFDEDQLPEDEAPDD